jgi:hypothetical protein
MVPAKVVEELKQLYESEERVIDLHQYSGPLFDVVFEIITADTFVAGVASKIVDREVVTPEERAVVTTPLLLDNRMWRCDDGEKFDIQLYPEINRVAKSIESLRAKCQEALSLANNS